MWLPKQFSGLRGIENNLEDLRKTYVGAVVVKPFYDEALQRVRDYNGEVMSVDFSNQEGCFLFQVKYDSDSDGEEMEHWELKTFVTEWM